MTAIRKCPPLPFQGAPVGHCRACGAVIPSKSGQPHKGRKWCNEHRVLGAILHNPVKGRAAVFLRDFGICCDCGTDCTSYETLGYGDVPRCEGGMATYRVQINREKALEWCEAMLRMPPRVKAWVIDLGEWDVDHAMPLHLVDRADPGAWKQWTLENLRTRCHECHEEKTTKEAKGRAKIRRITGANKTKPKRKIPSRPFQKRTMGKMLG